MKLRQALEILHRAGRIRSPWLPGMAVIVDRGTRGGRIPFFRGTTGWWYPSEVELPNHIVDREAEPVLADPATVGVLLALLREASGDPYVTPQGGPHGWSCWPAGMPGGWPVDQPTEGEAIDAALVALAVLAATEAA